MNKTTIIAAAALAVCAISVYAQQPKQPQQNNLVVPAVKVTASKTRSTTAASAPEVKAVCPVTRETFTVTTKTLVLNYKGKTYFFPSKTSMNKFKASPQKYAN